MTEQELRLLVREAVARDRTIAPMTSPSSQVLSSSHASHAQFVINSGADMGGPCVIEPTVPCNHCGYCKSYGH